MSSPGASPNETIIAARLETLCGQFDEIERALVEPDALADHRRVRELSVRRAALEPVVSAWREYRAASARAGEAEALAEDPGADAEFAELARQEAADLRRRAKDLLDQVQRRLVSGEEQSIGSLMLELRAGVGGDEAALWAGDLIAMYRGYAASRRWSTDLIDVHPGERGGIKSAILRVSGEGAFAALAHESGTHQVKRVPATEAQGRVHTSTATVAVLPEPEEIEVRIDPGEVREMITTAQGPGGQNVNKVATAVHLIHKATGLEVRIQDTKSQSQNREIAWRLLRARVYDLQKARADAERAEARNAMIGTARRAEKIRTYRYKENLVVDHRLGAAEGSFNLSEIMQGRMQPLLDALTEQETARRLAAL
jgi:peptide chain release factor 1